MHQTRRTWLTLRAIERPKTFSDQCLATFPRAYNQSHGLVDHSDHRYPNIQALQRTRQEPCSSFPDRAVVLIIDQIWLGPSVLENT